MTRQMWRVRRAAVAALLISVVLLQGSALASAAAEPEPEVEAALATPDAALALALAPSASAPVAALNPFEAELIRQTNADRAKHGLAPLSVDTSLLDLARQRAAAQRVGLPLNHYTADGALAFQQLLDDSHAPYQLAGENLARSAEIYDGVIQRIEEALMASPGHRKNILEPGFNTLTVGVALDPSGAITLAEIFRQV